MSGGLSAAEEWTESENNPINDPPEVTSHPDYDSGPLLEQAEANDRIHSARLAEAGRELVDEGMGPCRVCGCTDLHGCPDVQGGCYWVDEDLSGDNGGPLCSEHVGPDPR